jgi:hypothetical protein
MKLLKIQSTEGVDIVLIAVDDDRFDEAEMLARAEDYADFRGNVYLDDVIDIPDNWLDTERPFTG